MIAGLKDWLRVVMMYRAPHPDSERILEIVERLLDTDAQVHALLHGEPGTGKEGLARALHSAMRSSSAPFIKIPTGGRDPEVLALHLFGTSKKRGAIARAQGGTLFLDEVGGLPREIQARLSPVLRGTYRRNDDEVPQRCDITVIGATDLPLPTLIRDDQFRHDLYFRMSRIELTIPPLRERPDDIPRASLWALGRLLRQHDPSRVNHGAAVSKEAEDGDLIVEEAALEFLKTLPWHGNFRELDRFLERVFLFESDGRSITLDNVRRCARI